MVENNPVEIQKEGSYVTGLIGALVGALIGAVAWCLVMQLGIIASLVGFVIGWLAEKGYTSSYCGQIEAAKQAWEAEYARFAAYFGLKMCRFLSCLTGLRVHALILASRFVLT